MKKNILALSLQTIWRHRIVFSCRSGRSPVSIPQSQCLCPHLMPQRRMMGSSCPWSSPQIRSVNFKIPNTIKAFGMTEISFKHQVFSPGVSNFFRTRVHSSWFWMPKHLRSSVGLWCRLTSPMASMGPSMPQNKMSKEKKGCDCTTQPLKDR